MNGNKIKRTLASVSIASLIGGLSLLPACTTKKAMASCGSCGSKAKASQNDEKSTTQNDEKSKRTQEEERSTIPQKGGSSCGGCGKGSCGGM